MIVTYSPKDEAPQRFEFDPAGVLSDDAELMEIKFGDTWDTFNMQLLKGSMRARRVMLWYLLKQVHPVLRFEDVRFVARELEVEFEVDELNRLREGFVTAPGIDDATREQVLAFVDQEIAKAGEAAGKVLSEPTVTPTG